MDALLLADPPPWPHRVVDVCTVDDDRGAGKAGVQPHAGQILWALNLAEVVPVGLADQLHRPGAAWEELLQPLESGMFRERQLHAFAALVSVARVDELVLRSDSVVMVTIVVALRSVECEVFMLRNPDEVITPMLRKRLRGIGLDEHEVNRFSSHSFRATFVTLSASAGVAEGDIAEVTRHRSLASVGIYRRVPVEKVAQAAYLGER